MGVVDESEMVVITVGRQMMVDVGGSRRDRGDRRRAE